MRGGGVFSVGPPLFYTPKLGKNVGERGGTNGNYHSTPTICHQFFIPQSTLSILSLFSILSFFIPQSTYGICICYIDAVMHVQTGWHSLLYDLCNQKAWEIQRR